MTRFYQIDPFAAALFPPGSRSVEKKPTPREKQEAQENSRIFRKELLPVEVEGLLNQSYDAYCESGAQGVTWTTT